MNGYFPKPNSLGAKGKVELDLSNYATKTDPKNKIGVDTLDFAKKTVLANLKSDVDKLDIDILRNVLSNLSSKVVDVDKLVPAPVDVSKLSHVGKNVVKKDVYNAKIKHTDVNDWYC